MASIAIKIEEEEEKPHKCDQCNKRFAYPNFLTTHYRTHTGEKPFKCDWEGCNYAGIQRSDLTVHYRTHTGDKPFKCDREGCDYASAQAGNLKTHIIKKHPEVTPSTE